jgi:ectoine hydroxylase-related dioxygenase (phytanoyl-CoA dioxygenase family)
MQNKLTPEQRADWERDGFFVIRGFTSAKVCRAMRDRITEMVRANASGESIGDAYVTTAANLVDRAKHPEDALSKLFRIHRSEPVFREFLNTPALLDLARDLIGPDVDCFLSQFIAKHPGSLGQPWHQDAFYFPFDRGPQVGLRLAVTDATADNGPLWVIPGSQRDPVHEVVRDTRPHADFGYFEILDRDTSNQILALMKTGDLLVFHSHLMHRSTDNQSDSSRMAMVYHLADSHTVDQSEEKWGFTPPNTDWMPLVRNGNPTEPG